MPSNDKKNRMVPVSYTMTQELRDGIIQEAEIQEVDSASSMLRRIVRRYLASRKHKPAARETDSGE